MIMLQTFAVVYIQYEEGQEVNVWMTSFHLEDDDDQPVSKQDVATLSDLIQPVKPVWSQWVRKMEWDENSQWKQYLYTQNEN